MYRREPWYTSSIDELRGVRPRPRFVRIDAALGGQKYGVCPPSAVSMRTNRGQRLAPHNSSTVLVVCSPRSSSRARLQTYKSFSSY